MSTFEYKAVGQSPLRYVMDIMNRTEGYHSQERSFNWANNILNNEGFEYGFMLQYGTTLSEKENNNLLSEILRTVDGIIISEKSKGYAGRTNIGIKLLRNDYRLEDLAVVENDGFNELLSYSNAFDDITGEIKIVYGAKLDKVVCYRNDGLVFSNKNTSSVTWKYPLIQNARTAHLVADRELTKLNANAEVRISVPYKDFNLDDGDCFILSWKGIEGEKVFRIKHGSIDSTGNIHTFTAIEEPYAYTLKGK